MSAFDGKADLLATLIASTATFQSVTGKATVAAAKAKIGLPYAFDDDDEQETEITYPRAIITDGGVIERTNRGIGSWGGVGSLYLAFEFESPATYSTIKTQRSWFLNKVSSIIREAEVISDSRATPSGYTTTHLVVKKFRREYGPEVEAPIIREQPDDDSELLPLWVIEFEVEY